MKQYLDAVREILETGTRKENRTGVDTLSTFGITMKFDLRGGNFPLLTTKKVSWKNIVVENLWFLSGEPDIALLQKHGCKFWDAWADDEGRVPSAYGNFWRQFPVHQPQDVSVPCTCSCHDNNSVYICSTCCPGASNDQIAWVVGELKRNPMSRRLVVLAWAPGNAHTSKLPPCHVVFVLNVQHLPEKCSECNGTGLHNPVAYDILSCPDCLGTGGLRSKTKPHLCLHLTQRSCDIALGVPYNIAGYALLLELFARFADMPAGVFAHTLVDAHAYTSKPDGSMAEHDHVPGLREQLTREPRQLPWLVIDSGIRELQDINRLLAMDTKEVMGHFTLEGYDPHPAIKFKVAV